MKRTQKPLRILSQGVLLGLGGLLAGCLALPPPYKGDYSEFVEARERAEAEKAARTAEREAAQAARRQQGSKVGALGTGEPLAPPPLVAVPPPAEGFVARQDDEIERDVREALDATPLLKARHLSVQVATGLVTLEGLVLNPAEAAEAVSVASRVDGVRGVYDLLELDPRQELGADRVFTADQLFGPEVDEEELRKLTWSDYDVERAIESFYARTGDLDAIDIEVQVVDGVVVLSGRVSSARERQTAAAIAARVGARPVRNELEVRPAFEPVRPKKKSPL